MLLFFIYSFIYMLLIFFQEFVFCRNERETKVTTTPIAHAYGWTYRKKLLNNFTFTFCVLMTHGQRELKTYDTFNDTQTHHEIICVYTLFIHERTKSKRKTTTRNIQCIYKFLLYRFVTRNFMNISHESGSARRYK